MINDSLQVVVQKSVLFDHSCIKGVFQTFIQFADRLKISRRLIPVASRKSENVELGIMLL